MEEDIKFKQLTENKVQSLILKLAAPTILSMLISTLYNMADAFFVGQINASASGSISVIFSYMAIIQAFGYFFGHGSGNYISLKLGEQNHEEAEKMASTGFFSSLTFGFLIMTVGLLFTDPLISALGSTETIRPHAKAYLTYILLGTPYMTSALTLNNQLRFQGNAFYAMIALVSGGLLNIGLDAWFVLGLGLGTGGAGLATMLSQLLSFVLLFTGVMFKGSVKIHIKKFCFKKFYYAQILRGGLPSLGRQSISGIATVCTNFVCRAVMGVELADQAIAALGNVTKIIGFCSSAVMGFGQGFQPVCGFNYGAKKFDRVLKGYKFSLVVCTAFAIVVSIAGIVFAKPLVALFTNDALVEEYSAVAFRYQCLFFIFNPFITISNMLMQNIGRVVRATTLGIARQGIAYIPLLFILGFTCGLWGLETTQAFADLATFLLAIPLTLPVLKDIRRADEKNKLQTEVSADV